MNTERRELPESRPRVEPGVPTAHTQPLGVRAERTPQASAPTGKGPRLSHGRHATPVTVSAVGVVGTVRPPGASQLRSP